ncbi:MAG: hypothetical protein ACK4VM_20355 [Bosea sp. (in: a-proteobacteria)]
MVTSDIEAAKKLVAFLDSNGFPVKAALWLYESEAERWRFVISLQERRDSLASFYLDLARVFNERGLDAGLLELDRVKLVDADRPLIRSLSKGYRGLQTEGRRLSNEQVDGHFFEDALILRLPA